MFNIKLKLVGMVRDTIIRMKIKRKTGNKNRYISDLNIVWLVRGFKRIMINSFIEIEEKMEKLC